MVPLTEDDTMTFLGFVRMTGAAFALILLWLVLMHFNMALTMIVMLCVFGGYTLLVAAVRDRVESKRQTDALLRDIETRDLRLATRWEG